MTAALLHVGLGKADITVFEPDMCMFGWGQPGNVARDVAMPLFARALAIACPRTNVRIVYVCADLGIISIHLRERVIALLAERDVVLRDEELMLTATHTHSGPNGFSPYLFYSVTGPGFSPRIVEGLARGIVRAIAASLATSGPARLRLHAADMPLVEAVAFNRSLDAYNLNTDVDPVPIGRSDEAVDRRMTVLRIDDVDGRPRGLVSWFPTHGTSIHHESTAIHPDNKGIAAQRCEALATERLEAGPSPFIAIFAQEAAGDVTPNFRWSTKRGLLIGRHEDDLESADFAGAAQARLAWQLFNDATDRGTELRGPLAARIRHRDFASLAVDADFADGREGRSTTTACLGLGFAFGTLEGPGPAFHLRSINGIVSRTTRWRRRNRSPDWRTAHGAKFRFFDLGRGATGNILAVLPMLPRGFQRIPDRRIAYYHRMLTSESLGASPWVPNVLPIQVFRIGELGIVGLPIEPTTVSGRRLRSAAMSALASTGVERTVINGYANGYASYVTTFEEYQLQRYEGASTLFGEWTLAAWCTELRRLCREMASFASMPRPKNHRYLNVT